jgi:hypothetical protein
VPERHLRSIGDTFASTALTALVQPVVAVAVAVAVPNPADLADHHSQCADRQTAVQVLPRTSGIELMTDRLMFRSPVLLSLRGDDVMMTIMTATTI